MRIRPGANKGRTIVDQSRAQKEQNSCKTKEVENQAQRRPNIEDIIVQKNVRQSRPSHLTIEKMQMLDLIRSNKREMFCNQINRIQRLLRKQ